MNPFSIGNKIKMKYYDRYVYGEITITREHTSKVLFDGEFDLAYDYYENENLILISDKEYNEYKA